MKNMIYPCLWFEKQAYEAASYYCEIFPNSQVISASPTVVHFQLQDQFVMALNYKTAEIPFTDSFSMVVQCDSQAEIDRYWSMLIANGGAEKMCGWCVDKFGVSWQIVPRILAELMSDSSKSEKVMQAFLKMKKFDIETLLSV